MMFRNTIKLFMANFANVWKILFYQIVAIIVSLALWLPLAMPAVNTIAESGFFDGILEIFRTTFFNSNIYSTLTKLYTCMEEVIAFFKGLETVTIIKIAVAIGSLLLIYTFIYELCKYSFYENIYGIMSSYIKFGFMNRFVLNIRYALKMTLARMLVTIPIDLFIAFVTYLMLKVGYTQTWISSIIAPMLIIFILAILIVLRNTFLCGWYPAKIVQNKGVFTSLGLGVKALKIRFYRVLSTQIILGMIVFAINSIALFGTFGIGLIITIPASCMLYIIFDNVMYFGSMGMRYYTDLENIVVPPKLEDYDQLAQCKYII